MKIILNNIFKNKLKEEKKSFIFGFFWLSSFVSLNLNPEEINIMNSQQLVQLTTPFLLIFTFFIYFFKNKITFIQVKRNNFFYFFISYILLMSFFTLLNTETNSYLNIYWGLFMVVPIVYIFLFQNNYKQLKFFLFLSLLLLFSIFGYFFFKIVVQMFLSTKLINLYGISDPSLFFINNDYNLPAPRSSGLSRMAFIIYIALTCYLIATRRKIYGIRVVCILAIIIGAAGLAFHSRVMNFIFIIFSILLILIYFKKKNLINRKFIIFLTITPIILAIIYNYYAYKNTKDAQYLKFYKGSQISEVNPNLFETIKNISGNTIIRGNVENFSSSRFDIWRKAIEKSKKNLLIGYGFQADRKLIKESSHNIYIYSLICGGLISLLLITFISLRAAWVSFIIWINFLFLKKNYEPLELIPLFLVPLFLLRGILETSYGIYSIDYLFFIICFFINEINYKKNYLYETFIFSLKTIKNKGKDL
jgi:hypothetical protein